MKKANVVKSSRFYMKENDILHLLFMDEDGTTPLITLNSDDDEELVPGTPVATAATDVLDVSFSANWHFTENATGYYLDVATDSAFTSLVGVYDNLNVGLVDTYSVTGLDGATTYYYRIRAYNLVGSSENSNTISLHTIAEDWFLPSKDESNAMYTNLHAEGVGGFTPGGYGYVTSSESYLYDPATDMWMQEFNTGVQDSGPKSLIYYVRACRAFASTTNYNLRDIGPTGGYIFWKSGNDYLEATSSDCANSVWSNITDVEIGTTGTAIGTGQANTTAIIGQAGHTNSAAKLCDDLVI